MIVAIDPTDTLYSLQGSHELEDISRLDGVTAQSLCVCFTGHLFLLKESCVPRTLGSLEMRAPIIGIGPEKGRGARSQKQGQ